MWLARQTADLIKDTPHLELIREPDLGVVLFRRVGWKPEDYDGWAARLHGEGIAFIPPSKWDGETVGRFAFLHPGTSMDLVREVLRQDRVVADLLSLFPPGSALADDGDAGGRRLPGRRPRGGVRHAGAGRVRDRAALRGLASMPRARRAVAALTSGVRVEGVPVHRRATGHGRGRARARRRRAAGRSSPRSRPAPTRLASSCCTATPRPTTRSDGRRPRDRPDRGRQRRRRRPARGDRAAGAGPRRAGAHHPGRHRRHPRPRAHRPRGLEVRTRAGRGSRR